MLALSELKSELTANRTAVVISAAVTILAGVLFSYPQGNFIERWSFDLPFLLAPTAGFDGVVIVKMDADSYTRLHLPRTQAWPRSLHARLLNRLLEEGARLAVFDVSFADNSPRSEEDTAFADAISSFCKTGKVVAAVELAPFGDGFNFTRIRIAPNLTAAFGSSLGDHELYSESDLWIRRHRELRNFPSLAWVAAKACDAPITKTEADRLNPRWIRFYGPAWTLPNISYADALDPAGPGTPPGYFHGKLVFIGAEPSTDLAGKTKDEFGTPFTRWTQTRVFTPGTEIHATMFLNLMRNQWLTKMDDNSYFVLIVISGMIFGIAFNFLRPLWALAFAGIGSVVIPTAAILLFWWPRIWFDWLVIVAVQLPVALASSMICHVREKDDRTTLALPPPWPPPDFELLKSIGEGSFGEVWLARGVTGAYVALKKVYRGRFSEEAPFLREWTGVANFFPISREHSSWVCVLHVVKNDGAGFFYYAMEVADDLVTGQKIDPAGYAPKTLKALLNDGCWLPVKECVNLGIALSDAISALHERGFIHRDVKPANIIFVKNVPKFADIGLVVRSDQTISFVGTIDYIPPEHASSRLADIYALGKVLYQVATGSHARDFPGLPTSLGGRSDAREVMLLMDIVNKACESNPEDRYQSGAEMREDLKRLGDLLLKISS